MPETMQEAFANTEAATPIMENVPGVAAVNAATKGNFGQAVFLGALDAATAGKGKAVGSLASPLGRALADAGRGAIKGLEDAHHIVAQGAMNEFSVASRAILEKAGIGIHDAVNGVALPSAFHDALHTMNYYESVAGRVTAAYKAGGTDAVKAELSKIGAELKQAAKNAGACAAPTGSHIPKC